MLGTSGCPIARGIAAAAVAALLAACGSAGIDATPEPQADTPATTQVERTAPTTANGPPTLIATTIGGSQVDVSGLVGQDTLLWFWAPW